MFFNLCQWLFDSELGTSIRESTFVFPLIETTHVLAIALLVGTVAILDLRLWGVVLKGERVTTVARQLLPLTWAGFSVVFSSGLLLFIAEAAKLYANPAFRLKLLFLILVGLNPLVFHFTVYRDVDHWDAAVVTPPRARLAGGLSLALWAGIIVAGRAIAYYH